MSDLPQYKIAIVAPIHTKLSKEWVNSLKSVAKNHTVIIVHDSWSGEQIDLPSEWDLYDYARQEEELGTELFNEFKIFHKSSACRNFGHWIAYRNGFDVIIGLDSDCVVPPDFISKHLEALMFNAYGWENTTKSVNWFPRGFPYFERSRRTVLNIGLWNNELDVNGIDRVHNGTPPKDLVGITREVAHGMVPLCGMNFACWAYAIPAFLFIPNFDDGTEKFRRYDDIWGGYIFQKLMQKNNEMITYGQPIVYHDTVVDGEADAALEEAGIKWEETFYGMVDLMCEDIDAKSYDRMFKNFVDKVDEYWGGEDCVFRHLIPAFKMWVKFFEIKKNE